MMGSVLAACCESWLETILVVSTPWVIQSGELWLLNGNKAKYNRYKRKFFSPQEKITFLVSSFGSRCLTQCYNFPGDKNFQICVLGNKFVLNLGLMWYFPCYIDLVLMVLLELSSINFTWRTCYNLLGHFLMEAIMRTLKVSSKPSGSHDLPGVCKMKSLKYPVKVDIASNFQNVYKMPPCFRCGCRGGGLLSLQRSSLFSSPGVWPVTQHYLIAPKVGIAFWHTAPPHVTHPSLCLAFVCPPASWDSSIRPDPASAATVTSVLWAFAICINHQSWIGTPL